MSEMGKTLEELASLTANEMVYGDFTQSDLGDYMIQFLGRPGDGEGNSPPGISLPLSATDKQAARDAISYVRHDLVQPHILAAMKRALAAEPGEILRFQNQIRELVVKLSGADDHEIDGSGTDSGDPVDLTLSEIAQGFNIVAERHEKELAGPPPDPDETWPPTPDTTTSSPW